MKHRKQIIKESFHSNMCEKIKHCYPKCSAGTPAIDWGNQGQGTVHRQKMYFMKCWDHVFFKAVAHKSEQFSKPRVGEEPTEAHQKNR